MVRNRNEPPFYGKYRGVVVDNLDTDKLGRIKANVPSILGNNSDNWALPCVAYAGRGVGMHIIPPIDAHVWIEFEGGNPDCPIWSGCFWEAQDVVIDSAESNDTKTRILKTGVFQLKITEGSSASSLLLEIKGGQKTASLTADNSALELKWGTQSVKIEEGGISINGENLKILP